MNKYSKKISNKEIKTEFSATSVTQNTGLLSFHRFLNKIGIEHLFNAVPIKLENNTHFSNAQILLTIIYGLLSGENSILKIDNFSRDPLLQELLNIKKRISDSTISDRLKRFTMASNNYLMEVNSILSGKIHQKLKTREDIIDIDSTVKTVYGNQEGAAKGFNSHKKGAKSYHPLMAFLNSTRECILSWLRSGDAYTSNNAEEFIKEMMRLVPNRIKSLLIRGDSGFFSEKIIETIENYKNVKYLFKVKIRNLSSVLSSQQWKSVPYMPGYEICDFQYRPESWKKARHFYALRILKEVETENMLFPVKEYEYFCYCTNEPDNPLQIHKLYGDRGTSENWIEHVKNQMYGGKLLTDKFFANETLWLMSVMAYNTSIWLRKLTDEYTWHEEPDTFRRWFISVASKVIKTGRQTIAKMSRGYYYRHRWRKIESLVKQLTFA